MSKKGVSLVLNGERARSFLAWIASRFTPFAERSQDLMDSDRPLVIDVYRRSKKRSTDQNALYWAWLECIGEELGYTREEAHYAMKSKLLGVEHTAFGPIPMSTTKLSTIEMRNYMNQIDRVAAEYGIPLPRTVEEWEHRHLASVSIV